MAVQRGIYPRRSKIQLLVFFSLLFILAISSCSQLLIQNSLPEQKFNAVMVYFLDVDNFASGNPPFEVGVIRIIPSHVNQHEAVLGKYFKGPSDAEKKEGIEAILSGFTGFTSLSVENGIARVHLSGKCASMGATYSIAQLIMKNLLQFPEIKYVKIFDENGETELPDGFTNSIPFCLEP